MGERHVEDLFSTAYDGLLDERAQARFDAHLAGCERCAAGLRDFRVAVDAVRALPAARMPVRVVLPATPPVAERRSQLPPSLARLRLPRPGPAFSAGLLGAVGIAVVVLAVHGHGGSNTAAGSSVAFSNLPSGATSAAGAGAAAQRGAADAATAGNCVKPVLSKTLHSGSVAAAAAPTGFANRVSVGIPQRPGQELVLATTGGHYTPGSQVLVYAVLTTSSAQRTAVVPCVTLRGPEFAGEPRAAAAAAGEGGTATASGGASSQQYDSNFAPNSALSLIGEIPLAVATATTQSVGELPVQAVTIPANLPPGSVVHLVAVIPAGVPGSSDQEPVEAVLTLDVS